MSIEGFTMRLKMHCGWCEAVQEVDVPVTIGAHDGLFISNRGSSLQEGWSRRRTHPRGADIELACPKHTEEKT
jgi:hypothetical protein